MFRELEARTRHHTRIIIHASSYTRHHACVKIVALIYALSTAATSQCCSRQNTQKSTQTRTGESKGVGAP